MMLKEEEKQAFIQAVYNIVSLIPEGRATSYGLIAKAIGFPTLFRMVGKVMSQLDASQNNLPAHRVVNNQGILSGEKAFGDSNEMQQLLEAEGIIIINSRIKYWKRVRWNPLEEI